jgi:hypothetical protein
MECKIKWYFNEFDSRVQYRSSKAREKRKMNTLYSKAEKDILELLDIKIVNNSNVRKVVW